MASDEQRIAATTPQRPGWTGPWNRAGMKHDACGIELTLFAPALTPDEWHEAFDKLLAHHEQECVA